MRGFDEKWEQNKITKEFCNKMKEYKVEMILFLAKKNN
jgi:hypothetical protein